MAEPHVIRVRFDGGPRHGRTVDLIITGHLPLMLSATTRRSDQDGTDSPDANSTAVDSPAVDCGLYELRCTEGRGTRYAWIDDLPVSK